MRTTRFLSWQLLAIGILSLASNVIAQRSIEVSPSVKVINYFGSVQPGSTAFLEGYLSLAAVIESFNGSGDAFSDEQILFAQKKTLFPSWFPTTKGNFTAIADGSGYISILGDDTSRSESSSNAVQKYEYSVFDRGRKAWVNPAFFLKGIFDIQPPQITTLSLETGKTEYDFKESKSLRNSYPQGRYSILVSIFDPSLKSSSSGVFRIKVVLDGMAVLDNKLDLASASEEGLCFLGHQAPSRHAIGNMAKLRAGEVNLIRGEHVLEIFAYDFAGNDTSIRRGFRIE